LDRRAYERVVEAVRDEIARGSIYQANLTRRLGMPFRGDPWPLYRRLRTGDPALFAAFLDLGSSPATGAPRAIVSASPEPFLSLAADGRVAADPIKGTRPRGRDRDDDRRLAAELLASEKDRAENVMIVDLARNDLGRICEPGSITVPSLCVPEEHPGLAHLVSTVRGRLRADIGAGDLVRATFPPASVTGAPKPRVLEIIEELETVRRGVYCGAIGWIDTERRTGDLAVAIRTFVTTADGTTFGVGAGIVADSDPIREWEETELKAHRLIGAAGTAPPLLTANRS